MNYLFYCENSVPDYLKFTLNSVLSVDKDAKIYLCSRKSPKFKNVEFISQDEVISNNTKKLLSKNLLDKNSISRIFILHDIQRELNIKDFVHLDNDVVIYKPFNELKKIFEDNKVNVTKPSNSKILFGYSYFDSIEILDTVKKKFIELIKFGISTSWSFNYGVPYSEFDILGKIFDQNRELVNLLPILPYENEILFDPSSYGHFLDGTETHPKKFIRGRYINHDHYVGREVKSKRIKIKFKKNKPIVIWKNQIYQLANLHLYSKRFNKYLPIEYKEFV